MKVGIYGQYYKEDSKKYIHTLLSVLKKNKAEVFLETTYLDQIKEPLSISENYPTFSSFEDLDNSFDIFLSVGGDGTMLRAVLFVRDLNIPILGINTGRLGFLATVQKENLEEAVEEVLNNGFEVKERTLLQIATDMPMEGETEVNFALNEIAVSRKNTTSMITIATWLDGEYLTSYWADGLIVSTPTGSTGYSLSCNGPVIAPSTDALVLTPIAPHNLNARPLVIPDKTEIKLKVSGREESFLVSLDSRIATLSNEAEITITQAPFKIKLVDLADESFLKTLRKKLLWGEDKRN
ncbi:NAD kinase [Galbibacter sp. EGI 63066]|uniref:NAD kinase n=1 Tax=Galbibacter sp. EGI 63066 TaxID=2993559 RepID=UPI002248BC59|nr:NAD kinase [Galbibacter sp. EGI 63066]MCX2681650.1 NAD kinase [Galbibacter sp. EGI 63066]